MRLRPFNPYISVVIGVIAISSSAVLVKLASAAPASIVAFYHLFFALIFMTPIILTKYKHEFRLLHKRDWLFSILAGVFLALHFLFWFESLHYTSVASSVVLISLQPIFAFIGTYLFFQEKFSYGATISMIITILGSFIIVLGDSKLGMTSLVGDIFAILGALFITIHFLFGQQIRKRISILTHTFIIYGVSIIILLLYNLLLQYPFVGYPADHWWIFITLAILPTFFGRQLFNWSLKWLSVTTVSMAIVFEPLIASFLAYLILGDEVTASQLLGGTIILFGLFLFIVSTSRKRQVTISTVPKTTTSSAHTKQK